MKEFKSFSDLPNPNGKPEKEVKTEKHELMLEQMGVSPEDEPKLSYQEFFDLAMDRCGGMGKGREFVNNSRRVILASIFQKAFIKYYGLKGPQKNVEYAKVFDRMYRDKQIDFIAHSWGKDSYLCSPIRE